MRHGVMMLEYPVEIPESAREVKANYPTRPSDDLIREIKNFIADTGLPHHWPGHTHTKPAQGAIIVYRGEFDLPKSHAGKFNRSKWAPCPCCHPETAWYWNKGKIAWFPEESVIRLIGGDCFKKINAAGHAEAIEQFRREERARRDQEYLLQNLDKVPQAIRVIAQAIPAVEEIDKVRFILASRLSKIIGFDIWNDIRADGVLKTHDKRTENFARADGTEGSREVPVFERYGALDGYTMLNPTAKPLAPKLEKELERLRQIDYGNDVAVRLAAMDDAERHRVANLLAKPISIAREIFAEAEDCRRLITGIGIATLNGWGRHEKSPASIYMELSQGELLIGRTQSTAKSMKVDETFFNVFGQLPSIGSVS